MKIHYIFLHFHWEAVYKERHLMQFVHGIACMCRWARASLKAQVTSVSFVLMSWTPLSIPDGTKCLFLGQWIQPFVSSFLSYKLVRTISCCSVALFLYVFSKSCFGNADRLYQLFKHVSHYSRKINLISLQGMITFYKSNDCSFLSYLMSIFYYTL